MDWLPMVLEIVVFILCIVFEVLYFKERLRRKIDELMYLEHRERWLQICERLNKRAAKHYEEVISTYERLFEEQKSLIDTLEESDEISTDIIKGLSKELDDLASKSGSEKESAPMGGTFNLMEHRDVLTRYLDEVENFLTEGIDVKTGDDMSGLKILVENMEREGYQAILLFRKVGESGEGAKL